MQSDEQGSSTPFRSFGRSIFSAKRDQVHSMEGGHESGNQDIELFLKQVSEHFHDLSGVSADELLSIEWISKLLDAFISCQEEFRVILLKNKTHVMKPPLDHLIAEFFERSVKALDICNATRDGVEKLRLWHKHLEIVLCSLHPSKRMLGEGQFRRARKALNDLALSMLDEKESASVFSQRNRSFGRNNPSRVRSSRHPPGHSRSLSWSVSRSWSAAKQLQSMANNLVPPRGAEIMASNGVAVLIFAMNSMLLFVLWTLVAAIPCQDRGLNIHFQIPRSFSWGVPILSLFERITEESKKREHKNSNGLLKEVQQIEKCTRHLTELVDLVQFPLTEENKTEVEQGVQELAAVCDTLQNSLDPLEHQVREVFRKIMGCRTDGLEMLGSANNPE